MSYAKPPVLAGSGKSDYENYLRTDELLSLQKNSDQWEHRDELLFTIVHQTSELWLKLASAEVSEAIEELREDNLREPQRLLGRAVLCIHQIYNSLDMLEKMSPWDYQQVRRALGHGSGFDSPGFNLLRKFIPQLRDEFQRMLFERQIDLLTLFLNDRMYEDLYQLAEWLLELDEQISMWRFRHFKVVERSIGGNVRGTQGTPVEVLSKLNGFQFFPELWEIRSQITDFAISEEAGTEARQE
jgi:tryptophan 2,3-dioxygenase